MDIRLIKSTDCELWKQLGKLFTLPKHCKKVVLTMELGHAVQIEAVSYVANGSGEEVTRKYMLQEVVDYDESRPIDYIEVDEMAKRIGG